MRLNTQLPERVWLDFPRELSHFYAGLRVAVAEHSQTGANRLIVELKNAMNIEQTDQSMSQGKIRKYSTPRLEAGLCKVLPGDVVALVRVRGKDRGMLTTSVRDFDDQDSVVYKQKENRKCQPLRGTNYYLYSRGMSISKGLLYAALAKSDTHSTPVFTVPVHLRVRLTTLKKTRPMKRQLENCKLSLV